MNDLTIQDRVKRLYQRHFGPGHMIADGDAALAHLKDECAGLRPVAHEEPVFEKLGNGLARLHLRSALNAGLSPEAICAMFEYTANRTQANPIGFAAALDALDVRAEEDRLWLTAYRQKGCPATSHSQAYRDAFSPAYRVVYEAFEPLLPLLARIDDMGKGIIAIDGPCASGKSTLAGLLSSLYGAPVFHMDDFFLRPEQRTAERLAVPGGNVDRERFLREVLTPLQAGGPFVYRPYDCAEQVLAPPIEANPGSLNIVEGAYSLHPELRGAYGLKVFMNADDAERRDRLLKRNGPVMLRRFVEEWIPMEDAYFEAFDVAGSCDVILEGMELP